MRKSQMRDCTFIAMSIVNFKIPSQRFFPEELSPRTGNLNEKERMIGLGRVENILIMNMC